MGMQAYVRCVLAMLAVAFCLPAHADPRPFELRDGQVVIMVTIKDREIPALLDTGATVSLMEVGLAKELGVRFQRVRGAKTVGASGRDIGYGRTDKIVLDLGAGPTQRSIGIYPAGNTFAAEGVRLLIGMDFLDAMVLSLDFQTMTMDVQRSSSFKAPEAEPTPLAMTRSGWRRHILPVDLGGARAELLLDTAASGALHLDSTFVARTSTLNALPVSTRRIAGIDGIHDHDAIVVPSVDLGGEVFEDVHASSGPLARLRAADTMDGLIGVDLLKRFNLVIDFGGRRIWMTPNANRDAPFRPGYLNR